MILNSLPNSNKKSNRQLTILIEDLIKNAHSATEHGQPLDQLWHDLYTPHRDTPFTEADGLKQSFPDLNGSPFHQSSGPCLINPGFLSRLRYGRYRPQGSREA